MSNNNNASNSNSSIIRAVIRECEEKLTDDLCCDNKVTFWTEFLYSLNFLSKEERKSIRSGKTKIIQCKQLLSILEASRNDEILDAIIKHLREEEQDHLYTLLEYSRVKHKRIRNKLIASVPSQSHHM